MTHIWVKLECTHPHIWDKHTESYIVLPAVLLGTGYSYCPYQASTVLVKDATGTGSTVTAEGQTSASSVATAK